MRLFPKFATSLICVGLMAGCQNSTKSVVTADTPQSDQKSDQKMYQSQATTAMAGADAGLKATAESAPPAPAKKAVATRSKKHKHAKKVAHHSKKHSHIAAHHHIRQHHKVVRVTTQHPRAVAMADIPQSDRTAEREEFKRMMSARILNIGDKVGRYHNSASITDSLTRYDQKIEDIKIADALANKRLENVDNVSNTNWPTFKLSFQEQVSQLELDYNKVQTASR